MLNFKNLWLSLALVSAALLLIGSNRHDASTVEKAVDPATEVVASMAREIPAAHRAEWAKLAAEQPLVLFRCGLGER